MLLFFGLIILLTSNVSLFHNNIKETDFVVKDIKFFGAKGDGRTNDHLAFEKAAAFFNKRKGNGKLIVSKGIYIVGKQSFTKGENGKPAYYGSDLLHFSDISNFTIEGKQGSKLKYINGLRFGSFNPTNGQPYNHPKRYFVNYKYAAFIGHCLYFENSTNIKINGLEIDGNSQSISLGGTYGDVGRQLPHYGIFLKNSRKLAIERVNVHHFGLDGICVANNFKDNLIDNIKIIDSKFDYNSRQGFSWIGGKGLLVQRSSFNHSGKGLFASSPSAGVDIEAEVGPISEGFFEECEFINNSGCGLVADNGNTKNCIFSKCTFWGTSAWSIWLNRPAFTFKQCNIYGSFVHGYNASEDKLATKFIECKFEDKSYKSKPVYGKFLIESNGRRRVSFDNCFFIAHKKKLCWVQGAKSWTPDEKYQFFNCHFLLKNAHYPKRDFVGLIRSIRYKDCTFEFEHPLAKEHGYWLNDCCGGLNTNLGGNKYVYTPNNEKD